MNRRRAGGAAAVAVAAVVLPHMAGSGNPEASDRTATPAAGAGAASAAFDASGLDPAPAPAFQVPAPRTLARRQAVRWAPVIHATRARRTPSPAAAVVAAVETRTPERTTNIVVVLRSIRRHGRLWALVRLPVLPNGTVGWVPRAALGGYHFVRTRLLVDRARLRATLQLDGRAVFQAPVGVGTAAAPTPAGEFYIRDRVDSLASPFYGPIAFGTSARSPVLTDWPGGGFVGIHGTNAPELIPGRVSHGCIRLRNSDILELARLMPVGTPVTVR
jgi:hypothetical protein